MKLILFFLFFSFTNSYANCVNVETKIIFAGKPEIQHEDLCEMRDGRLLFYVSKSCEGSQCPILMRSPDVLVVKDYRGNIGSPGFKLCRSLSGIPQIFEWKQRKWQSSERCFFGKDFVEISLLTRKWKPFIKTNQL